MNECLKNVNSNPKNMEEVSPDFSIVIPIYNEEENIPELYRRLTLVMERMCSEEGLSKESYEIILVDDGSGDSSWRLIKDIHKKDIRIKGISFSRNFGHHIAITAGLDYARGNAVILSDGDLQDPPEEIPKLYKKFKEGYDLIYGIRQQRHDPLLKKLTSYMFWGILKKFSEVHIPQGQTMLRIMSRRLVNVLKEMGEHARFIHGMMAWVGFKVDTMEIKHDSRLKGKSKYDTLRMFKLAFHAITSFSTLPLRFITYCGLICSFMSFIFGAYFIYQKVHFGILVLGYASIIVSIFFIGGIQLLVLGVLGEYIGRTYQEVQRRPLYVVKEHL